MIGAVDLSSRMRIRRQNWVWTLMLVEPTKTVAEQLVDSMSIQGKLHGRNGCSETLRMQRFMPLLIKDWFPTKSVEVLMILRRRLRS